MTIENKDPTTTVESVETIGFNMKQARDDSSDLAKKPIEQCGLDDINNNNNKNGPSSMDLEKSATCDTIVTSSTQSDEDLTTRQQEQTITAYLSSHDCVVVIIMASSIIDKDTTIKGFQQNGYNVLQQQSMKLSDEQIDILYAYDEKETKLHYRQLFDGWKKSSQSDQVQVVVLEKENAVQSFLSLVTNQNSTKKKNRMMDPQSVYSSNTQDIVKRDLELLFKPAESNKSGELVSSATVNVQGDTVTQTPPETSNPPSQKPISTEEEISQHPKNTSQSTDMLLSPTPPISVSSDVDTNQQQQSLPTTVDNLAITTAISTTVAIATFNAAPHCDTQTVVSSSPAKNPPTTTILPSKESVDESTIAIEQPSVTSPSTSATSGSSTSSSPKTTEEQQEPDSTITDDPKQNLQSLNNPSLEQPTTSSEQSTAIPESVESINEEIPNPPVTTEPITTTKEEAEVTTNKVKSKPDNSDEQTEDVCNVAPKKKSPTKKDIGSEKASRDTVNNTNNENNNNNNNNKKQSSEVSGSRPTTRKVPDAKSNKNTPPSPPVKSKLRATGLTRPTSTTGKPADKQQQQQQQQQQSDTGKDKRSSMDETKKKVPRVPRVALLANQSNKNVLPNSEEKQEKQQPIVKPKIKASHDAIARLTAPTASSARRQQTSSTSSPSAPSVNTTTAKGTSVTATFKLEQRRKQPESVTASKKESTSTLRQQPRPVKNTAIKSKKIGPDTNTTTDKKNNSVQGATKKVLASRKAAPTTASNVDIVTTTDSTTSIDITSTEKTKEKKDTSDLQAVQEEQQTSGNDSDHSKNELASQSPADSSTTSSRPQTPVQQRQQPDRTSPTTNATTTTGAVTLDTASATPIKTIHQQQQKQPVTTSKVKDLLSRFTS